MAERGDRRLEAAVALGIITAGQAAEIRAIAPIRDGIDSGVREAPRAFNAAMLAYVLGAITVVIAMGWFLADRWNWLGAKGVLAVSVLYVALFLLTSVRMRRGGFPTAAGFAVLLALCMVPVATVAWNELVGWFARVPSASCGYPEFALWSCRGEELFVELVTAVSLLVALRQIRFSLLVLPLAGLVVRGLFHVADAVTLNATGDATSGWILAIGASVLAAAAYSTDRRQAGDEDFGIWLHLAATACALVAAVTVLNIFEELRHFLIPGAFVAFAVALTIRRFIWMLLGMAWFIWYLGWLASDVFRDSPLFPVILAALGLSMIVITVWVQRNASWLVERFGSVTHDGRPRFPGGVALLLSPALVAALLLPQAAEHDRLLREHAVWQSERYRLRYESERQKAVADSIAGRRASAPETPPVPRP